MTTAPALRTHRVHPAWWVAAVTFLALIGAAAFRSVPGVLIDRIVIAEPGQHRGGDRFDEIRRGVGDHRRAVRTAGVHRLERYFRQ